MASGIHHIRPPHWPPLRSSGQGGFRGPAGGRSAFLFSFVHSIDDQKSANILLHLDSSYDFRKGVACNQILQGLPCTLM